MTKYAEVAVDAPAGYHRTFTYSVPSGITVSQGHLVHAPFGPRVLSGIVFRISDESPVSETREIARVPYPQPVLSPRGLALASWTSSYYMASLFDCAALMAPPGISLRAGSYLSLNHPVAEAGFTPSQRRVVSYLKGREKVRREVLLKALGPDMEAALGQLARRGVVNVWSEWRKPTARPRHAAHLELTSSSIDVDEAAADLEGRRAYRQADLLRYIGEQDAPILLAAAGREFGASAVKGLQAKGLVSRLELRQERDPLRGRVFTPDHPPVLTQAQEHSVRLIERAIDDPSSQVFLLQGVTGSGKTEVYLRALAYALRQRQARHCNGP